MEDKGRLYCDEVEIKFLRPGEEKHPFGILHDDITEIQIGGETVSIPNEQKQALARRYHVGDDEVFLLYNFHGSDIRFSKGRYEITAHVPGSYIHPVLAANPKAEQAILESIVEPAIRDVLEDLRGSEDTLDKLAEFLDEHHFLRSISYLKNQSRDHFALKWTPRQDEIEMYSKLLKIGAFKNAECVIADEYGDLLEIAGHVRKDRGWHMRLNVSHKLSSSASELLYFEEYQKNVPLYIVGDTLPDTIENILGIYGNKDRIDALKIAL